MENKIKQRTKKRNRDVIDYRLYKNQSIKWYRYVI